MGFFSRNKKEEKTCCCGNCGSVEEMVKAQELSSSLGIKVLGSGCSKCNALNFR